jgi:hypothetical protein
MRRRLDATDCLQAMIVSKAVVVLQDTAQNIPAKSGHEENSKENDTKESNGMPALSGADLEIAIGFDLEEIRAASTLREAMSAPSARER